MERIIFAAIKLNNTIIYGKNHAECIRRAVEEFDMPTPVNATRYGGFLTSKYRFVYREEAKLIAVKAEQIRAFRADTTRVFLSEELWSKESGGIHSYDPDKGYFIPDGTENI